MMILAISIPSEQIYQGVYVTVYVWVGSLLLYLAGDGDEDGDSLLDRVMEKENCG